MNEEERTNLDGSDRAPEIVGDVIGRRSVVVRCGLGVFGDLEENLQNFSYKLLPLAPGPA